VGESIPLSVHNLTKGRVPLSADGWMAMVHGVIAAGVLLLIRVKWHRFPLQTFPFAAALGPQWMMDRYGFSIFIGWIVKSLVLKYGSVPLYNKLRPAAFGIICGNAFILLFWTIYHYFSPISGVLVIE
jgi:hypothetical protein